MRFIRFLVGVVGVILLFGMPGILLLFGLGSVVVTVIGLLNGVAINPLVVTIFTILCVILFFVLSVYMIWWGFIDKENFPKRSRRESKRSINEDLKEEKSDIPDTSGGLIAWLKSIKTWDAGDYIFFFLLLIVLIIVVPIIISLLIDLIKYIIFLFQ